jgi:hypothetical protein
MKPFELVLVLISMVISLALTQLLSGLGRTIRAPKVTVSLPHAIWSIYLLLECVDFWMSLWLGRDVAWDLPTVEFIFADSAALYLSCWLIVPEVDRGKPIDFVAFFEADRRRILGAIIAYLVITTLYMASDPNSRAAAWTGGVPAAVTIAAFVWRAPALQVLAAGVTLGLQFAWETNIWHF